MENHQRIKLEHLRQASGTYLKLDKKRYLIFSREPLRPCSVECKFGSSMIRKQ